MSALLSGLYDNLYLLQRALEGGKRARFFSGGFGDIERVLARDDVRVARLRAGRRIEELDAPLELEFAPADFVERSAGPPPAPTGACGCGRARAAPPRARARLRMREATARSPVADLLPPAAQTLRLLYICDERSACPWDAPAPAPRPGGAAAPGGAPPPPSSIVVLLPSTGEQGYRERVAVARALLARSAEPAHCLVVMAPMYAARRPEGQRSHFARTVAEYQAQSSAIFTECAALLAWAHAFAPRARLCASGFSWGAAMCAGGALLASRALPAGVAARQLCVAAYVGSKRPTALLSGLLAADVDFAALEREAGPGARARLRATFERTDFARFVEAMRGGAAAGAGADAGAGAGAGAEAEPLIGSLVTASMSHDFFVVAAEARELHDMLAGVAPPARTRRAAFPGGHATASARRSEWQVATIEDALAMLPGAAR